MEKKYSFEEILELLPGTKYFYEFPALPAVIPIEDVITYRGKYASKVNWKDLSRKVRWEYIISNMDFPWEWYIISCREDADIDFMLKNRDIPWFWSGVSRNPKLNLQTILENPTIPWDFEEIGKQPYITWDIVQKHRLWNHPDKTKRKIPWSFRGLSMNPNITPEIVLANPKCQWSYPCLSCNPNITEEFVKKTIKKNWDPYKLYRNPALSFDFLTTRQPAMTNWWYYVLAHETHRLHSIEDIKKMYEFALPYKKSCINLDIRVFSADTEQVSYEMFLYILEHCLSFTRVETLSRSKWLNVDIIRRFKNVRWILFEIFRNPHIKRKDKILAEFREHRQDYPDIRLYAESSVVANDIPKTLHLLSLPLEDITWEDITYEFLPETLDINPYFPLRLFTLFVASPNVTWEHVKNNQKIFRDNCFGENCAGALLQNTMHEPVRRRIQERNRIIQEELIQEAYHPRRIKNLYDASNWSLPA